MLQNSSNAKLRLLGGSYVDETLNISNLNIYLVGGYKIIFKYNSFLFIEFYKSSRGVMILQIQNSILL